MDALITKLEEALRDYESGDPEVRSEIDRILLALEFKEVQP